MGINIWPFVIGGVLTFIGAFVGLAYYLYKNRGQSEDGMS
jgi:hypothetical protein